MTPPTFLFLKAKSELVAYAAQVGSRLLRLKAGFNPNQPRLPAGNPDGGQWTDAGAAGNALSSPKVAEQRIVRDRAGEQPWSSYIEQYRPDGSVVSRAITNRNGSKIAAAYSLPGIERNTVTLRNGVRLTFENNGDTQRVLDASGNLLSETALTLDGTAARPVLRPVLFDSRNPVRTPTPLSYPAKVVLNAATELYNWWQSSKEPDEEVVFSFRADKLVPVPGEPPLWTSKLKREEVEDACPWFPLVQRMTNQVAKSLNPTLFKNKRRVWHCHTHGRQSGD